MKQLVDALCELAPLTIQCFLVGVHQIDEKGWSKEACMSNCAVELKVDISLLSF